MRDMEDEEEIQASRRWLDRCKVMTSFLLRRRRCPREWEGGPPRKSALSCSRTTVHPLEKPVHTLVIRQESLFASLLGR